MKRGILPLLAASIASVTAISQANASFTYDLRVVSGPTAATNNGHLVVNPAAGDYTLQVWGEITGDTNQTNDSYAAGYYNISSNTGSATGLAFSGAGTGVTNNVISVPPFTGIVSGSPVSLNGAQSNTTNDGVADWGTNVQTDNQDWALWQSLSGVQAGGSVGDAINANTWEVMLATVTIHVGNVNLATAVDQQTDFSIGVPASSGSFGFSVGKTHPVNYTLDGVPVTAATAAMSTGTGVTFDVPAVTTPEPASLGVLGLGVLGLIARRRRV